MNKFNESHAERFENDKPDSLTKRPQKIITTNNISIRKFKSLSR